MYPLNYFLPSAVLDA